MARLITDWWEKLGVDTWQRRDLLHQRQEEG